MKTKLFFLLLAITTGTIIAADIHVPTDYSTIQEAIIVANPGDVIIVENGLYIENIDFLGKAITITSNFIFSGDVNDIINTIIDGSQPTNPDIGSCVSFKNGEGNDSVLQGFTIMGGSGTKTYNPADDAYFRTGGGILINQTSPTIKNNIIKNNHCIAEAGVAGAGGGGIRMGFGQPIITNNIITGNSGGYAGGIMIAYCGGATISNNLISYNLATGSFNGGGGIYVDWEPVTLENNTIVNNHSGDKGGALITTGTTTIITNCIIYGNTATNSFPQIYKRFSGNANLTYTNIEGGFDGAGNEEGMIDENPLFEDMGSFLLSTSSPCVDAGNPDPLYNDIEDPLLPGNALFPSRGTTRNDMGVYGGMGTVEILAAPKENDLNGITFRYTNPYNNEGIQLISNRDTKLYVTIYGYDGKQILPEKEYPILIGKNNIPITIKTHCLLVISEGFKKSKTIKLFKK
ncbi:MAG: hypothetical protein R2776_00210 [Flavobacteriaceae bacterium]|nr:hypothetical protein [Flavobacteriaceae bacterium]